MFFIKEEKMKQLLLLFPVLLSLPQLSNSNTVTRNQISRTIQDVEDIQIITINKDSKSEPSLEDLCRGITFSPSGLTCYFKHIYNCPKYAQELLPALPFKHLEEFLQHGISTNQPRTYTKAVFRLFDKKFKAVPYINAEEIVPFIKKLPTLLEKCLETEQDKKSFIKKLLRFELENNFELLKNDPDTFLDTVAEKIVESDGACIENDINCNELRFSITRFIDTCLNKVIWSPSDKQNVWNSFIAIGQEISALKDTKVIKDNDDLDDCQWTLTTRFCLFLSLSGSDLPLEFYNEARDNLHQGIEHLDKLHEQEELILSKSAQIKESIMEGYSRAQGRDHGLISEEVVINT